MAQLIGTGKDSRYPAGVAFDVPEEGQQALIDQLIENEEAIFPTAQGDPQRVVEVANGVVRGDANVLPEDAKIAAALESDKGPNAHDIVHTGDPKAKKGEHELTPEQACERSHKVQPLATTSTTGHKADAKGHKDSGDPPATPTPRGTQAASDK